MFESKRLVIINTGVGFSLYYGNKALATGMRKGEAKALQNKLRGKMQ